MTNTKEIKADSVMPNTLRSVRLALDLSQEKFAEKLGVSKFSISGYEKGDNMPGSNFILNVVNTFGVNAHYLFTGTGKMFIGNNLKAIKELTGGDLVVEFINRFFGEIKPQKKLILESVIKFLSLNPGLIYELGSWEDEMREEYAGKLKNSRNQNIATI